MLATNARYLTLHGGLVSLGEDHASLHQDVLGLSHVLKATGQEASNSWAEVQRVQLATATLSAEVAQLMQSRANGGGLGNTS